jgi:tRNA threonylcarbamoyladenosine biosynthesis protein TsaE
VTIEYISKSPLETLDLGVEIGKSLEGGEIILLSGDLGAGKTLLTKGIAQGVGTDSSTTVVSPSFTLVNIYKARLDIVHVDLYRLDSDEVFELGLEDFMNEDHIMVVEWAERARGFFQGKLIEVSIEYLSEHSRKISLQTVHPGFKNILLNTPHPM